MTNDTTCTQCGTIYPREHFAHCPRCAGTANSTQTRSVKPQNRRRRSRTSTSASSAGNDVPDDQWSAERDTALPEDIPADATCSRCDQPMMWEPSRTTIVCHTCGTVELPVGILAYQSFTGPRGTVAVPIDPIAERLAQQKLAGEIGRFHFAIDQRINYIDPRSIDDPTLADRCAELTGQLRYIRSQPIENESEIKTLITQLFAPVDSEIRSISAMIDRVRENAAIEYTQQEEPRELESAVISGELVDNDEPYDGATIVLRKMQAKLQRAERNGHCQICRMFHRTADYVIHAGIPVTRRGIHTNIVYQPNGTSIRVCSKHRSIAIERIEQSGYTPLGETLP